jgi:hypothetical protein
MMMPSGGVYSEMGEEHEHEHEHEHELEKERYVVQGEQRELSPDLRLRGSF